MIALIGARCEVFYEAMPNNLIATLSLVKELLNKCPTKTGQKSLTYTGIKLWDNLQADIKGKLSQAV